MGLKAAAFAGKFATKSQHHQSHFSYATAELVNMFRAESQGQSSLCRARHFLRVVKPKASPFAQNPETS
jgi:hypothetical protein